MTCTTNARIAGVTFLAYIVVGITDMQLHARARAGADIEARLASMARHTDLVRYTALPDNRGLLRLDSGGDAL